MQYSDPKTGERYIPRCVETSAGIGRQFMAVLFAFYAEESADNTRVLMKFPYDLAPIKYAIMPLVEKDENMVILAKKLTKKLKMAGISTEYDAG
jgi:glycyl-tRNA synthetase